MKHQRQLALKVEVCCLPRVLATELPTILLVDVVSCFFMFKIILFQWNDWISSFIHFGDQ